MADFIRVTDLRGIVRRVNTSAIVEYHPIPDAVYTGAAMVLREDSFDVRNTSEAIDKAVEAPGRIVDAEVSPDIPALG
ncbi:MAG TPA: hypothetical protein VNY52_09835 [Solirubrobacteraceae bacterium]|jgi:hypothetical protein|nr:hypothetical protein [Solirubrobacteraceae bacterium]